MSDISKLPKRKSLMAAVFKRQKFERCSRERAVELVAIQYADKFGCTLRKIRELVSYARTGRKRLANPVKPRVEPKPAECEHCGKMEILTSRRLMKLCPKCAIALYVPPDYEYSDAEMEALKTEARERSRSKDKVTRFMGVEPRVEIPYIVAVGCLDGRAF